MAKGNPTAADSVLVSQVAVDYVHAQGLGIGIVQQAIRERPKMTMNSIANVKQRKYGIKRQNITTENVKTADRAHMLGLLHALGLACSTITDPQPGFAHVRSMRVMCASPAAAAAVHSAKHHIENAQESVKDVVSTNDRMMIKRVVTAVRKLAKHVPAISADVAASHDPAAAKAARLAKQKGRKACRSRRNARLAQQGTNT